MCWSSFLSRNIIPLINQEFSALPRHLLQPSVMTSSLFFFFLWWSYRRVQHQTVSTKKIKKMKENRKIMNVARWYDFANLTFNLRALDCADSVFLSHQRIGKAMRSSFIGLDNDTNSLTQVSSLPRPQGPRQRQAFALKESKAGSLEGVRIGLRPTKCFAKLWRMVTNCGKTLWDAILSKILSKSRFYSSIF